MSEDPNPLTDTIVAAIARELALTGPESYPVIVAILGRYTGALAAAGLLAPAPLADEFMVRLGPDGPMESFSTRSAAEAFAAQDDEFAVLLRCATDWLPADRAEGDGSLS